MFSRQFLIVVLRIGIGGLVTGRAVQPNATLSRSSKPRANPCSQQWRRTKESTCPGRVYAPSLAGAEPLGIRKIKVSNRPVGGRNGRSFPLFAFTLATLCASSLTAAATPLAEIRSALARARPGDTVVLDDGVYRNPGSLRLTVGGEPGRPVTFRPRTPGGVTFQGRAQLRIEAAHVIVQGFRFTDGQPASDHGALVVQADDVRLTECTIKNFNLGDDPAVATNWVNLDGRRIRVDHCWFEGKVGAGVLLVLQRGSPRADHAVIERNAFLRFAKGEKGNGYETIRLGTSHQSQSDSRSIVAENYFEACDGEIEIISVKSGANTIRDNTFFACRGALTLRHGAASRVTGNLVFARHTDAGGLRINDRGHIVENNYIEGVRATSPHLGGIVLMSSESAEPAPAVHAHWPVRDIMISRNTVADCTPAFVYGGGNYGHGPLSATFSRNFASAPTDTPLVKTFAPIAAPHYTLEFYVGGTASVHPAGVTIGPVPRLETVQRNGYTLVRPANLDAGADLETLHPLHAADVGPTSYRP